MVVLQPSTHLIDVSRVERNASGRASCDDEIGAQSDIDRGPAYLLISVKDWGDRKIARRIAESCDYLVAGEEYLDHLSDDAEFTQLLAERVSLGVHLAQLDRSAQQGVRVLPSLCSVAPPLKVLSKALLTFVM